MLSKKLCLLILVGMSASPAAQQSPRLPAAKTVFIENTTGDSFVLDSTHLILAASQIGWTDDRDKADLILNFGTSASEGSRSTEGNAISISIRNFYSLDVTDNHGTTYWKDSVEYDPRSLVRRDRSERSWIEFLHKHPAARLTGNFLKVTK
jgi:hypothetical protein